MLPGTLRAIVEHALAEDIRSGDLTSTLTLESGWEARVVVRARRGGVFAGGEVIGATYSALAEGAVYVDVRREDGETIRVMSGRYGPYVKHGKINATIPNGQDPDTISLSDAVELIAAKKAKGPTKKRKKKKKA